MNIVFRVDSSNEIGSGHVMRCLTLAKSLRNEGSYCKFICRDHKGSLIEKIKNEGFEVHVLTKKTVSETADEPILAHAEWLGTDWQRDASETIASLEDSRPDWLIVDHYALDYRWEIALRPYCSKIMVIDDLADRMHDCDLLLDQNLIKDFETRYDNFVPSYCYKMLGPHWALLQPEYQLLRDQAPPRSGKIKRILVYFGGSDQTNLTGKTILAFLDLGRTDIILDVVVSESSPYLSEIEKLSNQNSNIYLYKNLPTLAYLMLKADLAIGAGGATSWERCCLGLPSLVITLANNQISIAEELDKSNFIKWMGNVNSLTIPKIKQEINNVLKDLDLVHEWSIRCKELVDGKGTERVASILMLNSNTPLKARKANLDDEALILQWANDQLVRKNSLNPNIIDANSHKTWFYNRLRNPDKCKIIIIETDKGLPIGQVRFDLFDEVWEIDYSLTAYSRGKGLGTLVLKIAILNFQKETSGAKFYGMVISENWPSRKVFENLGFRELKNPQGGGMRKLSIYICSDSNSWINEYIPELLFEWITMGHKCTWVHDFRQLNYGDICFYLSYGNIVDQEALSRFKNNLVVHESDLPKGKGWSPLTWQIIEGKNSIPVTLFEATNQVDSGFIYAQEWLEFNGTELIDELRLEQAKTTQKLCINFVHNYPQSLNSAKSQDGQSTFYKKRTPKDSKLDANKSIANQFNLLRVVDNDRYPAWFEIRGKRYEIFIRYKT
jgi:UDP-2,4-diacetamido-2,4,6-trideoxy-beta-L-altropyranose hydrolase